MRFWPLALVVLAAAVALHRSLRARAWREKPNYVEAIQGWTPAKPMALPAIRPLQAVVPKKHRAPKRKEPLRMPATKVRS